MKKVVLFFAIAIAAFSANAQKVKFGVKAGINVNQIAAKFDGESDNSDSKVGFYAGGLAEIGVSENFAVQPELLFSMVGGKEDDTKLNLSYISVPVLAKYKVEGFSIYLGPQVGFLMAAKAKNDDESQDIKDSFKSIDFAGVLGAGYTMENGFGFDARYQLGLSNILDGGDSDNSYKNRGFQVGVHYVFGGKK